jgi:hypothetical protein
MSVPDKIEIEVVVRQQAFCASTLAHFSAEGNFPMALDETHHRLFLECGPPVTGL